MLDGFWILGDIMIRILSDAETAAFLGRHPEIRPDPDIIPTWGLRVTEGQKDYVVALPRAGQYAGRIRVMDATVYDPETGERLDPTIADETTINRIIRSVVEGTAEAIPDIADTLVKIAIWIGVGFLAYKLILDRNKR
jgi:hypothetical protein